MEELAEQSGQIFGNSPELTLEQYAEWLCDICAALLDEATDRVRLPKQEVRQSSVTGLYERVGAPVTEIIDPHRSLRICLNDLSMRADSVLEALFPAPDDEGSDGEPLSELVQDLRYALNEFVDGWNRARPSRRIISDLRSRVPTLADAVDRVVEGMDALTAVAVTALGAPVPEQAAVAHAVDFRRMQLDATSLALIRAERDQLQSLEHEGLHRLCKNFRDTVSRLDDQSLKGDELLCGIDELETELATIGAEIVRLAKDTTDALDRFVVEYRKSVSAGDDELPGELIGHIAVRLGWSPAMWHSVLAPQQKLHELINHTAGNLGTLSEMYNIVGSALRSSCQTEAAVLPPFPESWHQLEQLTSLVRDAPPST
jgi:hypothetical protein